MEEEINTRNKGIGICGERRNRETRNKRWAGKRLVRKKEREREGRHQ